MRFATSLAASLLLVELVGSTSSPTPSPTPLPTFSPTPASVHECFGPGHHIEGSPSNQAWTTGLPCSGEGFVCNDNDRTAVYPDAGGGVQCDCLTTGELPSHEKITDRSVLLRGCALRCAAAGMHCTAASRIADPRTPPPSFSPGLGLRGCSP